MEGQSHRSNPSTHYHHHDGDCSEAEKQVKGVHHHEHMLTSAVAPVMTSAAASSLDHYIQGSHGHQHGKNGVSRGKHTTHHGGDGNDSIQHRMESGDHSSGVINPHLLKPVFPYTNKYGEQVLPWFRTRLIYRHGLFWMYEEDEEKFLLSAVLHEGTFYISQNATFPDKFNKSSPSVDENDSGGHCIAVTRPGLSSGTFQLFSAHCENCDDRLGTYSCEPVANGQRGTQDEKPVDNRRSALSGGISKLLSWATLGRANRPGDSSLSNVDELDVQPRELLAEIEQWQEELMNGQEVFRRMRINIPRVFGDSSRAVWCMRNPPSTGSGFSQRLAPGQVKRTHRSRNKTKRKVTSHYQQAYSPALSYSKESGDASPQMSTLDLSSSAPERSRIPPVHRGPPSVARADKAMQDSLSFDIPSLNSAVGDVWKSNGGVGSPVTGRTIGNKPPVQPHRGPPLQRGGMRMKAEAGQGCEGQRNGAIRSNTGLAKADRSIEGPKLRSKTDLDNESDANDAPPFAHRQLSMDYPESPLRSMSDLDRLPTDVFHRHVDGGSDRASVTDTASSARESFDGTEDAFDDIVAVESRVPRWSNRIRSFTLKFVGAGTRVKESSSKNFLFCIDTAESVMKPVSGTKTSSLARSARRSSASSAGSSISDDSDRQQSNMIPCLQFGKMEAGAFSCDFRYPFCALQAFGSALTSFYWLPASANEREINSDAPCENLSDEEFTDSGDEDY
eukprot:gb/GECG01000445.1/.p1 GENE.gb/GECG01000445.1/~~gb/GECG01000445.1/.p1  ORF type:complete len:730 (+),score=89.60 gb/GECG01000445.1/:1-2190(+)